jgi:hypothetical protein
MGVESVPSMAKSMSIAFKDQIFKLVHTQEPEDGETGSSGEDGSRKEAGSSSEAGSSGEAGSRKEAAAQQCLQELDLVRLEEAASGLASTASGSRHHQQFEVHIEAIFLIYFL